MKIQVLGPKITMENAVQRVLNKRKKRPISIELIYVPFCFFTIKYKLKRSEGEREVVMAVDMIIGGSGIYEGGAEGIRSSRIAEIDERQVLDKVIGVEFAENRAIEELRRMLFSKMLLKMKTFKVVSLKREIIYFPFWITYFETRKGGVEFSVINAMSGELDNPWYRAFIIEGFLRMYYNR